jgi:hypothetical protein
MKRLFLSLVTISLIATSCTENERVKNFGGEGTINLPAGRKLVNITWKDTEIWYLTRKMKDTDSAETYQFQEESSWGTIEGVYNIVESK